ncbi:MAG: bifunctional glycosyltransferase family 2/GtrA family protein [Legionellales bacterium]|jgi:glycosyltransferase involved in cell wall biosynthesis
MKIAIVIPAYEPDKHLINLVQALRQADFPLIIVDDGSGPDFQNIFTAITQENVTILRHGTNLGKGEALKTAFSHILLNEPDCIGIVTADADGQHLPADIIHTANTLAVEPQHLILGSRHFTGKIPLRSKLGNLLTRSVFTLFIGKKLIDTQTGLRGIPVALLPALLKIRSHGYEFELEMLIYAVQHHVPITELKIATIYENNNACSHFNPLIDSAKIYFVFLRFSSLGLITALVDLGIFTLCFMFSNTIFLSECLARGGGGLFSFVAGKHMVFKSKGKYHVELLKFFALWFTLLLTSYAMIIGAHELGVNVYLSKIITQTLLFLASFSIQRLFVFPYSPETTS